jgi:hypothetical protein
VAEAGAAVEEEHLDATRAELLRPDFVLTADDRHHPDAGGADTGRIEAVRMWGQDLGRLRAAW